MDEPKYSENTIKLYRMMLSNPETPEQIKEQIRAEILTIFPSSEVLLDQSIVNDSDEEALIMARLPLFSKVIDEEKKFYMDEFVKYLYDIQNEFYQLIPGKLQKEKKEYIKKFMKKYSAIKNSDYQISYQRLSESRVFQGKMEEEKIEIKDSVTEQIKAYKDKHKGKLPPISFDV